MAYFDSAKNRAIWQRELDDLDKERQRRAKEGYSPDAGREQARKANPDLIYMTYAQLEREEAQARGERYLRSMEEKRELWRKQREKEYAEKQKLRDLDFGEKQL